MSDPDRLEMLLRALPFDARMALEDKWLAEGAPLAQRLAEAEAQAAEGGDGCNWSADDAPSPEEE